jgi:hypothetical protein
MNRKGHGRKEEGGATGAISGAMAISGGMSENPTALTSSTRARLARTT